MTLVSDGGAPGTSVLVTSYRAPSLRRLGSVRTVRVHRAPHVAIISWGGVPGTHLYEIGVVLSDGTRRLYRTTARRLTVTDIFPEVGARVAVRAQGDGVYTASGSAGVASLRAWLRMRPRRLRA